MSVNFAPATRADINLAIEASPEYLRPILESVRDHHVAMLFVGQSDAPFRMPPKSEIPTIVIIGDDFDQAVGPEGFRRRSSLSASAASSIAMAGRILKACSPCMPRLATISGKTRMAIWCFSAAACRLRRRSTTRCALD